jgi:hypothetical protein
MAENPLIEENEAAHRGPGAGTVGYCIGHATYDSRTAEIGVLEYHRRRAEREIVTVKPPTDAEIDARMEEAKAFLLKLFPGHSSVGFVLITATAEADPYISLVSTVTPKTVPGLLRYAIECSEKIVEPIN